MLVRRPVTAFDLTPTTLDRTFQQLVAGLAADGAAQWSRRAGRAAPRAR